MKRILTFEFADDESDLLERQVLTDSLCSILWEIAYNTRGEIEDVYDEGSDAHDAIQRLYEKLFDLLQEKGVNLEKIYQ